MRIPYVVGTDISQISRFRVHTNPIKYARLARRIFHPSEIHDIWARKPNVAKILFPQLYLDEETIWLSGRKDSYDEFLTALKRPFHTPIRRTAYRDLLNDPIIQTSAQNFLAGRWAAKEAAKKAWGAELINWHDVRVRPTRSVRPGEVDEVRPGLHIELRPFIEPAIMQKLRPWQDLAQSPVFAEEETMTRLASVSISHDGDYATATVIATPLDGIIWDALRARYRSIDSRTDSMLRTRWLGYGDARRPLVPDEPAQGDKLGGEEAEEQEGEGEAGPADGREGTPSPDDYVPWWKQNGR